MNSDFKEEDKVQSPRFSLKRLEEMHPHQTLVYLGIVGILVIFTFLLIAFGFSIDKALTAKEFPIAFAFSTVCILLSSLSLNKAVDYVLKEELENANYWFTISLLLGCSFGATQFLGWGQLTTSGIFLNTGIMGAYFYLLSGLHLLHLVGGILFMLKQFLLVKSISKDPVKALVFVTNPYELLKLKLLKTYWHFMDGLWVIIFLAFLGSIL